MPASSACSGQAQPMYSIEQIELIRRLRNSGLTKEQVVQAFESFERVETELGNLYTVPISLSQQKAAAAAGSQARSSHSHHHQQNPNSHTTPPATTYTNGLSHHTDAPTTNQSLVSSAPTVHVNRRFQGVRRAKEPKVEVVEEGSGNMKVVQLSMQDEHPEARVSVIGLDGSSEVDEFLRKGSEKMHMEIQDFLFSHPTVMHNDIAAGAGVSVTCVSKFLIGNFTAIQPQSLRQLCQWFLAVRTQQPNHQQHRQQPQSQQQQCNSQTSKILQDVLQERMTSGTTVAVTGNMSTPMDIGMDGKSGDYVGGTNFGEEGLAVNFTPRRERFTFRKKHLEVLEMCFKTNQYPTYEERTDIAQRCNDIMEVVSGRGLGEKERMTPQNVAYWFSNRRKDIKRMAREGGIEMSEVVLPSKVKQSSPLSVLDHEAVAIAPSWTMETAAVTYSPLDMPSVGPVAFPTIVHRTFSETNTSADACSASSDSQGEAVIVKTEPAEAESMPLSGGAASNGPGSAVDRIAAEISSHLMSMTSGSGSGSASAGGHASQQVEVTGENTAVEPESH